MKTKKELKARRQLRIREKITGTTKRPRISVFRSNTKLYAQVIDDEKMKTIASCHVNGKTLKNAEELAAEVAKEMKQKKIKSIVFDRSGYRYHGVVKQFAEKLREGGLEF